MPHLHLEIVLHLSFGKSEQVFALYLVLVEMLLAIPEFYEIQKVQHLFDSPFLQVLGYAFQFRNLGEPIILQQKHHIQFLDIGVGLLEDSEILSCEPFFIKD